jgi:hypothetical protein
VPTSERDPSIGAPASTATGAQGGPGNGSGEGGSLGRVDGSTADDLPDAASDAHLASDAAALCPGVTNVTDTATIVGRGIPSLPKLVWNGTRYAAVWYDDSNGTFEVYFAFVEPSGVLAPGPITRVSPDDAKLSGFARLAWNGNEYGVVYVDDRAGTPARAVYFARVAASGALVSGSEIAIGGGPGTQHYPAIAWDPIDSVWGVAWEQSGSGASSILFARVSATGALVPASHLQVNSPGTSGLLSEAGNSPLVWAGSRFAIAWSEPSSTMFAEISGAGAIVPGSRTVVDPSAHLSRRATLAQGGSAYGVVWMDQRELSRYDVYFARVNAGGGAIANSRVKISQAAVYAGEPAIAWNGADWAVAWDDGGGGPGTKLWSARVDGAGAFVAGSARAIACNKQPMFPDIVWNGTSHGVAYDWNFAGGRPDELHVLRFP